MFDSRLAALAARHYRLMLYGWLFLAGCSIAFAQRLPSVLGDHGLSTQGSYARTQQLLAADFGLPDKPVVVLFRNRSGGPASEFHAYIAGSLAAADRIGGVDVAASPLRTEGMERDGYAYALLAVPEDTGERRTAIEQLRERLPDDPAFAATLTGQPVVQEDVNRSSRRDLKAAEAVGLPVAFALLVATFGGPLPAMIPIAAGAISVAIAMGGLYAVGASGAYPLSVFVYNVIPMAGMAVSIDFALLMVSRFREEKAVQPIREAVRRTMATSGRAVAVSAVCVILALIGTFAIRMPIFGSVALGAIAVLAVSALVNLTFVPALLVALGGRLPAAPRTRLSARAGSRVWLAAALKRPGLTALACLAVLALCLLPLPSMRTAIPGPDSLPPGTASREAAKLFADRFVPPLTSTVYFVAQAQRSGSEANRTAGRIRAELERDPRVISLNELPSRMSDGAVLLAVRLLGDASSDEVRHWVRERERQFAAMNVLVGGEAKYEQEVHDEIRQRMPYALAFVVLSNFLVLAWAFRSLLIPAKAIAMNLLSIGAALGVVSWLFREGKWGLETSDMAVMIPVFVFGLTFGISMDYGIFLLSRIYESHRRGRDNEAAIREGTAASARIIASAAAIMIAVTAPFALAGVAGVKQLGLGIALALFIDATIIRLLLVPSLMKLLGRWNWWLPL